VDSWYSLKEYGAIATARKNVKVLENWPNVISKFSQSAIEKQIGYIDKIEGIVQKHGITMEKFKELIQRPVEGIVNVPEGVKYLTKEEQSLLADIRLELIGDMDGSTVFEKTITEADVLRRINNSQYSNSVVGFITQTKDVKQLKTSKSAYHGLSMNYDGSVYRETNTNYFVRFITKDVDNISLTSPNKYPYTGNGFTKGGNGFLGIPELEVVSGKSLELKSAIIGKRTDSEIDEIVAIFIEKEGFIRIVP